jgi:hypothetical protein
MMNNILFIKSFNTQEGLHSPSVSSAAKAGTMILGFAIFKS